MAMVSSPTVLDYESAISRRPYSEIVCRVIVIPTYKSDSMIGIINDVMVIVRFILE